MTTDPRDDLLAEAARLLGGCKANDCPISPGPLRWVCRCHVRIADWPRPATAHQALRASVVAMSRDMTRNWEDGLVALGARKVAP